MKPNDSSDSWVNYNQDKINGKYLKVKLGRLGLPEHTKSDWLDNDSPLIQAVQ